MNEWISVKDRLPGQFDTVLVLAGCDIKIATTVQSLRCGTLSVLWHENVSGKPLVLVTHWMPLPELPKPQGPFIGVTLGWRGLVFLPTGETIEGDFPEIAQRLNDLWAGRVFRQTQKGKEWQ